MKLITIGHGRHTNGDYLKLVKDAGVKTVIAIRLRPNRASMGIWVYPPPFPLRCTKSRKVQL